MPDHNDFTEVYLDNAATTRPFDEVISFMGCVYKNIYANPSSIHRKGIDAERIISEARSRVAESLGVSPERIVFTSGGTESNNLAILGYLSANRKVGNHILCSPIEHPSVMEVMNYLAGEGYDVDYLSIDNRGITDLGSLARKLRNTTCLVVMMYVNNETGAIQPVEKAVELIRKSGSSAAFHSDAIQAYCKIPFSPLHDGVATASLSGHKIHGPKGVGALYVKEGVRIKPIIFGGGQEGRLRSGTENVAGIAGFGLAAEIAGKQIELNYEKISELKKVFIRRLEKELGGVVINSEDSASPYIVNVSFMKVKGQVLHNHLEQRGIFVSAGAACSAKKKQRSYILKAAGLDNDLIDGALRFSFGMLNTEKHIDYTIKILTSVVPALRKFYN